MNGHLKTALLLMILSLTGACTNLSDSAFNSVDYSGGAQHYTVYVPSQGRSIMSSLSF